MVLGLNYCRFWVCLPTPEIKEIVDTSPPLDFSISPNKLGIVFIQRIASPPLVELARPEQKLDGILMDTKSK